MIPDLERNEWIRTHPEGHRQALIAASHRAGSKLHPLIMAVKHWKKHQAVRIRSFHLEVLTYDAFPAPPPSYIEGLRRLFLHLATAVQRKCPDPAGVGPNVDGKMTSDKRGELARIFQGAAATVMNAITFDAQGRTEEAHHVLRELLGPVYPERGRKSAGAR
jgi:hypothetical protein